MYYKLLLDLVQQHLKRKEKEQGLQMAEFELMASEVWMN
jgi:hypothetical protein